VLLGYLSLRVNDLLGETWQFTITVRVRSNRGERNIPIGTELAAAMRVDSSRRGRRRRR
jgi:hypothetical protein